MSDRPLRQPEPIAAPSPATGSIGLLDVVDLGCATMAVAAACETGLVSALLSAPGTIDDLTEQLGVDRRATQRVLAVLEALGVADCIDGAYRASSALTDV